MIENLIIYYWICNGSFDGIETSAIGDELYVYAHSAGKSAVDFCKSVFPKNQKLNLSAGRLQELTDEQFARLALIRSVFSPDTCVSRENSKYNFASLFWQFCTEKQSGEGTHLTMSALKKLSAEAVRSIRVIPKKGAKYATNTAVYADFKKSSIERIQTETCENLSLLIKTFSQSVRSPMDLVFVLFTKKSGALYAAFQSMGFTAGMVLSVFSIGIPDLIQCHRVNGGVQISLNDEVILDLNESVPRLVEVSE